MSSLQSLPPSVTQFFLPSLTPPQTPSSFVELANLSNVNKEWRDKVIGAFVVKDKEGRREVNKNLRRCLCWFDEEGIEVSVGGKGGGGGGGGGARGRRRRWSEVTAAAPNWRNYALLRFTA